MTETTLPNTLFMDIDRSGPMPLYFQVAERIEGAIVSGMLAPGTKLDNEVALGERLGLSRPTIRRAIQELVDKGLLVRRRGIGTQVVHGQVTRSVELTSLYEDLEKDGRAPTTELLLHEIIPASPIVAAQLDTTTDAPVVHLRRVRSADSVPMAVLENYLPVEFSSMSAEDLRKFGLYQLLRGRGVSIQIAKQRIGARPASPEEARILGLRADAALLTVDRTAYDNSGRAVEYGHHCYRPDLYSFEMTLVDR